MIPKTLAKTFDQRFVTDGGLETTLVFHHGIHLPHFAAFVLLEEETGRDLLRSYYRTYAQLARQRGAGFILESPTWRANPDWGSKLGYTSETLARVNRDAIGLMHELREELETSGTPILVSGCVGPRGDGYLPGHRMSNEAASHYHSPQIRVLRDAGADLVTAMTLNYVEEAIGVARAAENYEIPVVISFTVETDGYLPTGQTLGDAIEQVDDSVTTKPIYYMVNCAHPTHFQNQLGTGKGWIDRIHGVRANASCRSHAELDESTDLDIGNPQELGRQYNALRRVLPNLRIFGGCCGTDHRHIEAICTEVFS